MFDSMIKTPCSWLMADGDQSAIVLSSRVRLARNIKGLVFPPYADNQDRQNVVHFAGSAIDNSSTLADGQFCLSEELDELDRSLLIERHLISPEFMKGVSISALYIGTQEKVSIMINEEDHLRIQALSSGLSLSTALERSTEVDDDLANTLEFDFDTDFGYLTSCPTNVGTGLRASILIHLAGLVLTKEIDSVIDHITKLGLVVRGFYGEGSDVWGNLFQISNQTTLGRSETDIVESLEKLTRQIIEFENKAREQLIKDATNEISDKIWRAYGILKHARLLTSEETMNLLSAVRLGIAMGILNGISIGNVNEVLLLSQSAHLQKRVGDQLTAPERDVARAKLVRGFLMRHEIGSTNAEV